MAPHLHVALVPKRVLPAGAGPLLVALAAGSCQAPEIAGVACDGNSDCPESQVCDPSHVCLLPIAIEAIGTRVSWEPVGWQLYTAQAGSQDEGRSSWLELWPKHADLVLGDGTHIVGPSQAHAPPYDTEALDGLLGAGFSRGSWFSPRDWTQPAALFVSGVLVPVDGAPMGSSPDFEIGPIIVRPVRVQVVVKAAAPPALETFAWNTRTADEALPDDGYDGWSHLVVNFWEFPEPFPGPGDYEFAVRLTEQGSNDGWELHVPFVIEAE